MWPVLLSLFGVLVYYILFKPLNFWKERNVSCLPPVPFFGNLAKVVFQRRSMAYALDDIYRAFHEKRYMGYFNMTRPTLIIRDPDLIKRITVKEFDTFPQHRPLLPEEVDPVWSKNIFAMRGGQKWHDTRATLSPAFTSSKMRSMFALIKECARQFVEHFSKGELVEIEAKDAFTRFTNDVIGTSAFGVSCNSLKDPDNEFYIMGKEATDIGVLKGLGIALASISPTLSKYLSPRIFTKRVVAFFSGLIKETIKLREEKGIVRPDMVHLMMETRKGRLTNDDKNSDDGFAVVKEASKTTKQRIELTDEDITAQSLIFFFAGFDTSSTMMSFASYELAVNSDIQEKLRQEVDECYEKNGEFSYDEVMGMKYLDMVISETLRKWPPFVITDRQCIRPFTIEAERPDEEDLHLETGQIVFFPTFSIQRDEDYYPNPEKFDPERFNDENKHKLNPFTYLPFGAGPKNCIGSRFALMEGKLIIAEIVRNFEIVPVEKTQIPLKVSKKDFNVMPEGKKFWIGLKPRI